MNRVVFYCDKCGKEIQQNWIFPIWIKCREHGVLSIKEDLCQRPDMELCEDCRASFMEHIEAWKKGGARWA